MDTSVIVDLLREKAHKHRAKELESKGYGSDKESESYLAGQAYRRKCGYNRKKLSTGR